MLTTYQISTLGVGGVEPELNPYTLGGDVELWYGRDIAVEAPGGYYVSMLNTGLLGGTAYPPVLDTANMPELNTALFSSGGCALFRASFGGSARQRLVPGATNWFKRLHTSTGGTMLMRVRTDSPLFNGAYGIMYSDMTGVAGNIGIHLKADLAGHLAVTLGNGVAISDAFSTSPVIAPYSYHTIGLRTRPGTVDPAKVMVEGFVDGSKVVETSELTPSAADASDAYGVIGAYTAAADQGQNMWEAYRFVLPILSDAQMVAVHNWFEINATVPPP